MDVAIVSDVHCDGPGSPTQHDFLRFLDWCPAPTLVLAGDIFHAFWAPGGAPFVAYQPVLDRLRRFDVIVLPGNHDFHLPAQFGAPAPSIGTLLELRLGGLRAVLSHGDEVDRSVNYRVLHTVLRGRGFSWLLDHVGSQRAWEILHRLAGPLGGGKPDAALVAAQRDLAGVRIAAGAELVVMGHTHAPSCERIDAGWFLNPGDWVEHRTYGVVRGREVELRRFDPLRHG